MAREEKRQMFYPNFGVIIVAQPSDETLWAGGTLLMHPETKWTIVTLCGGDDEELKAKFTKAAEQFNAEPVMGDFNVETEELSSAFQIQKALSKLLFAERFDVIITHSFWGEYSHTKMASLTAKSVLGMTRTGQLMAKQILQFAYEKKGESLLITPVPESDILIELDEELVEKKFQIITDIYGYSQDTVEVKSISNQETFWLLGQQTYPTRAKEEKTDKSS
ncbi:MAG: PIG-L family deacetylase [Planctomycetota bacterium]